MRGRARSRAHIATPRRRVKRVARDASVAMRADDPDADACLSDGARARVDARRALADAERGTDARRATRRPRTLARVDRDDGRGARASETIADVDGRRRAIEASVRREYERALRRRAARCETLEREGEARERATRELEARRAAEAERLRTELEARTEELARARGEGEEMAKVKARAEADAETRARAEAENETLRRRCEEACASEKSARESLEERTRELERLASAMEAVKADATRARTASEKASERCAEQEARVFRAVRAAERMKQRVEEAEQRASRAQRAMASSDESNAAHSCELVERAKREITDARRRNEDLETRLTQTTSELEALREKLGPDMERARLEGAQSYRVRIEALTTARDDLQREVEARQSKIDELERADAKARARYDELRRGAEFKIQTLEQRCANAERRVLEKEASVRVAATARDAAERRCEEHEKILEKSSSQDVVITSLLAKLEQRVCELYAKADSAAKLMQTQRKGDATKMAKLQARVRAARRARDAAKTRASRLVRENEESLMRIGIMEVQLKDAERMIENANREWLAECRRRETAESVSSRAEDELGEIRAKMNALESDRAVVQRENQKSYAMALEQNVHAEERIAELTSQLEALKSDLAAASEALAAAQVDVNAATTREQSLRWKSQELESSNANLQRAIDEQRAAIDERDGVEATLAKREEELANAEARSARLDCELTDAKIDARRAREAMAKMQSELDALRAQRPASSLSSELAVVEAIRRDLATPEPAKTVPGALALSPDQVQPSSTTATTTTTIIVDAPPEQKEQTRSTQPSPARRARRRANPFADKENPDASPKLTAVPRRQHTNAPLSPLSLLGVR